MKIYWFAQINDDTLFISPKGLIISLKKKQQLIKIKFRGLIYYRYKGTSNRIAQSTLKRNAIRCNVII
jgi:hypothetical protein